MKSTVFEEHTDGLAIDLSLIHICSGIIPPVPNKQISSI